MLVIVFSLAILVILTVAGAEYDRQAALLFSLGVSRLGWGVWSVGMIATLSYLAWMSHRIEREDLKSMQFPPIF